MALVVDVMTHGFHPRRPRRTTLAALTAGALAAAAAAAGPVTGLVDEDPLESPKPALSPAPPAPVAPAAPVEPSPGRYSPVRYRDSRALGVPSAGLLVRGTRLPARGALFATWDPILRRTPNRRWRRHGTDDLVRMLIAVARRYAVREPGELPMLIGDLSRPRGGDFGVAYGIVGHSTHQNGLDADVYYPRTDRRLSAPRTAAQVDRRLAQRLVDLFVAAGAEKVLVGPNLDLRGPPGVVVPYPNHDNHLHVRIPG